jgi:IS5 family transposase
VARREEEKGGRRSPVDRGKQGIKRSTAIDTKGIPLESITVSANRHDSPLLDETLDALEEVLGPMPKRVSVHLDHGYDSQSPRKRLEDRGPEAVISEEGETGSLTGRQAVGGGTHKLLLE